MRDPFRFFRRLERVRDYVLANIDSPIDLSTAADIAGLEPTYFSKFFRKHVGMTFRDWLRGIRIERAKTLLIEHNYTISEVAARVGYQSERAFQRNFLAVTGRTATEFRKQAELVSGWSDGRIGMPGKILGSTTTSPPDAP